MSTRGSGDWVACQSLLLIYRVYLRGTMQSHVDAVCYFAPGAGYVDSLADRDSRTLVSSAYITIEYNPSPASKQVSSNNTH